MAGVASLMGNVLQVNLCRAVSNMMAPPSPHFKMTHLSIQAALSIFGMISGPLLGLYLLGMLFRTTNSIVGENAHL